MTLSPGIFIESFERDDEADRHYAVIGRAVWLATRFENGCKTAAIMLGIKGGQVRSEDVVTHDDYIRALESFIEKERSKRLNTSVKFVSSHLLFEEAGAILDAARSARNEIAHDFASAFDYIITEPDLLERQYQMLREAVRKVAAGDQVVSILLSNFNGDPILAPHALAAYVENVVDWVCQVTPD